MVNFGHIGYVWWCLVVGRTSNWCCYLLIPLDSLTISSTSTISLSLSFCLFTSFSLSHFEYANFFGLIARRHFFISVFIMSPLHKNLTCFREKNHTRWNICMEYEQWLDTNVFTIAPSAPFFSPLALVWRTHKPENDNSFAKLAHRHKHTHKNTTGWLFIMLQRKGNSE